MCSKYWQKGTPTDCACTLGKCTYNDLLELGNGNGNGKGITSRGCGQPPREAGEGKAREKDKKKGKKHPRSRLAQAGSGERPVRKDQAGVTTEEKQA
jgi:hypothetical protein